MRRSLLLAVTLLAAACASRQKSNEPAPGTAPAATVATPAGTAAPGEAVTEYDLNHDGRPDVWKFATRDAARKELVTRKEKDLNGDGKVDAWETFGPDGTIAKLIYDMDFDGKPDVSLYFEKDQLVRKEYAFGFDGVPHSFNFYEKNKLQRKERDTNDDGRVDVWEYWEGGEIDRIGVDVDSDGQVDKWESRRTAAAEVPAK